MLPGHALQHLHLLFGFGILSCRGSQWIHDASTLFKFYTLIVYIIVDVIVSFSVFLNNYIPCLLAVAFVKICRRPRSSRSSCSSHIRLFFYTATLGCTLYLVFGGSLL